MQRNRITFAVWIFIVVLLGLASRSHSLLIPTFVKEYAGDTLWALAAYLMITVLFPSLAIRRIAIIAGLFSVSIEISQMYHAPWIDLIRHVRLGGLVLGYGFLWSDLICYGVGISIGVLLESSGMSHVFSGRRVRSA
ncbi:MAG: DUF2809 domain-containing protein [Nitrospira sp.]|nr:DUF2809 domain-containing protein [Nitrospira sp.]